MLSKTTPPHFVVNVQKITVLNALAHTKVRAKLFLNHSKYYICCAISMGVVLCALWGWLWGSFVWRVAMGFGAFLREGKLGQ